MPIHSPSPRPIIVIVGPSGVGKTRLIAALLVQCSHLEKVVTSTTRPPREKDGERGAEKDGVDYHFLPADKFKEMIGNGDIFEYDEAYGAFYGTQRKSIEDVWRRSRIPISALTLKGSITAKAHFKGSVTSIFIEPGDIKDLEFRLKARNLSDLEFRSRMEGVRREIESAPMCDFTVINNHGRFDETVREVLGIIELRAPSEFFVVPSNF